MVSVAVAVEGPTTTFTLLVISKWANIGSSGQRLALSV